MNLYCRAEAEAAQRALAESEEALRNSEKQLQDVLDNTTAIIYIKDTEGRYIFVNHRYEELFHVRAEDVRGKTDYDVFPKEIADTLRANDQKVLETGTRVEFRGGGAAGRWPPHLHRRQVPAV